ncbi:MAG: hypothetical protein ACFCUE_08030 [Candidatus Bathyarchaeia archaeon]
MTSALLLHLLTVLTIMIPSFVIAVIPDLVIPNPTGLLSIVGLLHGITGLIAIAFGVWFVATWHFKKDLTPCFNKKQPMRYAITVWVISLLLGIYLYIAFYGPLLIG